MVEDLNPTLRSQLKFINIAGIVPYRHVKKYGMNTILKHFVQDFKILENGIQLSNGETIHASCSIFSGDNLSASEVGGFRQCFVCSHPCRYCLSSYDDIKK